MVSAFLCVLSILGVLVPSSVFGQVRRDARLLVTVADQTGAVLPGATVKVDSLEAGARTAPIDPVTRHIAGIRLVGVFGAEARPTRREREAQR